MGTNIMYFLDHFLRSIRSFQSSQYACHEIHAQTYCWEKEELAVETKVKALKKYGCDLTGQVGEVDWSVRRHDEVQQMIDILYNKWKKNPLLIGEPGVGKIDVVRGLAHEMISRVDDPILDNVQVIALDIEDLMCTDAFEEGLKAVLKEVQEDPVRKVILFIDNIHLVLDADQTQWSMDAANLLLHMISTGQLWCIGGTTLEGHKKYLSKHRVFQKNFEQVLVAEPGVPETIRLLRVRKERHERHHGVRIHDDVLVLAAQLSSRYITGKYLPEKAINLVEEACVNAKAQRDSQFEAIDSIERKVTQLEIEFQSLKKEKDRRPLTKIRKALGDLKAKKKRKKKLRCTEICMLKERLRKLVAASRDALASDFFHKACDVLDAVTTIEGTYGSEIRVQLHEIYAMVSKRTGIPVTKLVRTGDNERLVGLADRLHQKVVGQDQAINDVAQAMLISRAGFGKLKQPIALFLFVGPDGAAKTELAEALAEDYFSDKKFLTRIYMPGFSGEVMDLAELVQRNRYGIVFFDGVDGTHDEMFSSLFLMLKQGWLKDPDTVLILNCNFDTKVKKITNHFQSGLINTLDEIVVFLKLMRLKIDA